MTPGTAWHNWAGNQVARPAVVARPRDVGELAGFVTSAAREGRRVKAIGSGHSFTAIGLTDGSRCDSTGLVSWFPPTQPQVWSPSKPVCRCTVSTPSWPNTVSG